MSLDEATGETLHRPWYTVPPALVNMKFSFCALLVALLSLASIQSTSSQGLENLRCIICKQIVKDLHSEVKKVDPKKKLQVRYRVDDAGKNMIPYALSEMHLSESLEAVCKGIDDYVRATRKDTGELILLKLIVDGKMNPDMSNVDIIQDGDLNKSLKYYCDGIVEEYEEDIVKMVQNKESGIEEKLCENVTKLCGQASSRADHDDL